MLDDLHPSGWGVRPVLFTLNGAAMPSYTFFMLLAWIAGITVTIILARRQGKTGEQGLLVLLAALVGGALGAKLPIWLLHYREIIAAATPAAVITGRTVVGGLIGGVLAVEFMKRRLDITKKIGNLFAPGITLGIAIGRIGCFLGGCCYGKPATLPWAVDFGDGIPRHPTQLYESFFALVLAVVLLDALRRNPAPGRLFQALMLSYFSYRFINEFLRAEPIAVAGLTLAQLVALVVIGYYIINNLRGITRYESGATA